MRGKVLLVGAVASLLAAVIVTAVSLAQTPKYEASAKVLVTLEAQCGRRICPIPLAPAAPLTQLARAEVRIDSPSVAKEAIRRLKSEDRMSPDKLLHNLTVQRDEPIIQLSYMSTNPERAKDIVGTVGRLYAERITGMRTEKMPVDT